MKTPRRNSRRVRAGMSLPAVMFTLIGLTVVGLGVMSFAINSDRFSNRGAGLSQANMLAESGIHQLYDRIRTQMRQNDTYPFALTSADQTSATRVGERSVGTFSARVVRASRNIEDVPSGSRMIRRQTWSFELEGTGIGSHGIRSVQRARFQAVVQHTLRTQQTVVTGPPPAGQIFFPAAPIVANHQVRMTTNGGIRTFSPDGRSGHVIGNDGIIWNPATGQKSANVNPNVLDIQGLFMTHLSSLAMTQGPNGLGNSNGTTNFRTPAVNAPGLPRATANTVLGLNARVPFASRSTVSTWQANWERTVSRREATRFATSLNSNSVAPRQGDQWRVITAPAVIEGDLTIPANGELRLMPSSSNPTENIIYVRGNVQNAGILRNLGVTVVVLAKYRDQPPAQYVVDSQGSPWGTRGRALANSALVSLSEDADAMQFNSSSSQTTGLLYAANGGIRVNGNPELRGLLVAGGEGSRGTIDIRPQGGASFVVHFEPEAAMPSDFDPNSLIRIDTTMVPDQLITPFNPTRLNLWVDLTR